ncbi:hydantoinase/oxoprolinase family protein [Paraburkholderia acidisoli]|uniref:Hydantoinase/oxoprolinase family protein n=1 Tax=Paraburkholderia acidisoli TaxID=2571748 RepID=A0A7Z2GR38_9BURK|nr:hydantoinase/oxoprolinase family protein [Paraburkholderia acidisoli]QGZ66164.1 hydantoinase/oxoprolinase family protein [Paraburkholderia acidisoli]
MSQLPAPAADASKPRLGIDIGGTFTDFVLEAGHVRHTHKRLTTPDAPERAVLEGVRHVLRETGIAASALGAIIHGTTLATNALIERRGARTALLTTEGFRDVIETGFEARADQYDLRVRKPEPLIARDLRFTMAGRMSAQGDELQPLDLGALEGIAAELAGRGVESLAIGFMHSYRNPRHEQEAARWLAQRLPGLSISLSSDVSPEVREFERFSTTAVNAYVRPLMASYLGRLGAALQAMSIEAPLLLMTSDGSLCDVHTASRLPVRLLESGPAGGALLAAHISEQLGMRQVLSLDIGGTTAKLCFIDEGKPHMSRSLEVARLYRFKPGSGIPLRIPVVELCEIGAGGGSIARVDTLGRVQVGPVSAGSDPGPACYALGGQRATLTDAHLGAGRLDPANFAGGTLTLDAEAARRALENDLARPLGVNVDAASYAVAEMADEAMASAAREHAIELGKSVAGRTMIAFGGSAPLHAARLAEKLGIDRVVIPAAAGVGSAYGFLLAPVAFEAVRSRFEPLAQLDAEAVNRLLSTLEDEAMQIVERIAARETCGVQATVSMRYRGQGHELQVALPAARLEGDAVALLRERFEAVYRERFGRLVPRAAFEVLGWSVRVSAPQRVAMSNTAQADRASDAQADFFTPEPSGERDVLDQSRRERVPARFYRRESLTRGAFVSGPAVIVDRETTVVVPADFDARVDSAGHLLLDRRAAAGAHSS